MQLHHLLLARDGTHCLTRSGYGYGLDPSLTGAAPGEDERWICLLAGSFAELLCRESDEIRDYERGLPGEMVQLGGTGPWPPATAARRWIATRSPCATIRRPMRFGIGLRN